MTNLELLTVGDASLDVFLAPSESEEFCMLKSKESYVCFSYGEKIPVKSIEYSVGGNAANNVVGTRRLGVNSAILITLGGDSAGNQIIERLEKEKVDMRYVIQQPTSGSNFSTIINYGGERTIFTYKAPRSYEFPVKLEPTPWVYLTSMGESFMPFYNHFVDFAKNNPAIKLAFNPGSRQLRVDVDLLKPVLEITQIIYVNREEAEKLTKFGESVGRDKELLKSLSDMGPRVVVVTDGPSGSLLYDSALGKAYKCGVMPVDAYERTGAGDAFGSGFLSAVIRGKSYTEALLWGTVNSASVIGYVGAQRGLLHDHELPEWIERAKSSGTAVVEI